MPWEQRGRGGIAPLILTSALDGGERLVSHSDRFTSGKEAPRTSVGPREGSGHSKAQKFLASAQNWRQPVAQALRPVRCSATSWTYFVQSDCREDGPMTPVSRTVYHLYDQWHQYHEQCITYMTNDTSITNSVSLNDQWHLYHEQCIT
jgi:hypothetical protein